MVKPFELVKASAKEFIEDKAQKEAAALAYYALFALGPLLYLALSLAGLFLGEAAARGEMTAWLEGILGAEAASTLGDLVAGAGDARAGMLGAAVSIAILLFAAGGLFGHLKDTLNTVWEVKRKPRTGSKLQKARAIVIDNLARFLAVAVVGALVLASIIASAVLTAVAPYVEDVLPGGAYAWLAVNALVSVAVFTLAFGVLFRWVPDARIAWRDVWVGAAVTAFLFLAGQLAIAFYLGTGALASRYGAAGAVVAILVWVYYSAMILLFGAELTQVYANRHGSKVRPEDHARSLHEDVEARHARPSQEGTRRGERGRRPG